MRKIKMIVLAIMGIIIMGNIYSPISVSAADGVNANYVYEEVLSGICGDNVEFVLTNDGVLTISGSGEMSSCKYSQPWDNVTIHS